MGTFLLILFALIIAAVVWTGIVEAEADKKRTPAQRKQVMEMRKQASLAATYGAKNVALVCPHCTEKGNVRTKPITAKKGVSGAKATGAILTGGVSLLATGLSRKENQTQMHCDNCNSNWAI